METLKKNIAIEPFIKRVVNRHIINENNESAIAYFPYFLTQEGKKIAYDIKVSDESIKEMLLIGDENRLRYRTFCQYYYLATDFEKNAKIYTICGKRWKISDTEITEETNLPIFSSIDDIDNEYDGVIIYENRNLLYTLISTEPSIIRNIIKIGTFCKSFFKTDYSTKEYLLYPYKKEYEGQYLEDSLLIPYADISLMITSDINDQGQTECAIPEWKGGVMYYEGQYIAYNKQVYRAERDIPITITTKGKFQTPDEEESGWILVENESIDSEETISAITESKVSVFLSKKKYIDDNLVAYPFYKEGDDFYFPYLKRVISDGEGVGKLEDILFNNRNIGTDTAYTFNKIFSSIEEYGEELSSVTFIYYLFDTCEDKEGINWDNAVQYKEAYNIETAITEEKEYFWIVTGNTESNRNMNTDLENSGLNPIFSDISYKVKKYSNKEDDALAFYTKISPIGSQNIKTDIDVEIERGSSALFERMNILGEVKSMRDLENYRNNFFEI